jgi:hypothetical protein
VGQALKFAYPEFDWDEQKFSFRGKKATQRYGKGTISNADRR